ncbi:MAG: CDP-alcohol phosphatidyltransferase family protein [Arenicellales bacterium]|jgi:cardiolipin synthase|nr:CDP-alcohol phosphatidyltransferase family protein [Arenicellales bacterium]|tara:strand:+ start:494 stop:1087 length:594 start_codon:yes stop_codon:yes gene_type:complete
MPLLQSIPNLLTLTRIGAVPVLILFLREGQYAPALAVFLAAGITDGLDGWIAKRFGCVTRLGTVLDPIADKMLIVSTYLMLAVLGDIPFWLLLLIGFRDIIIVGVALILQTLQGSIQIQPSPISKVNTFLQISLVVMVMIEHMGWLILPLVTESLLWLVVATTLVSGFHYIYYWFIREGGPGQDGGARKERAPDKRS